MSSGFLKTFLPVFSIACIALLLVVVVYLRVCMYYCASLTEGTQMTRKDFNLVAETIRLLPSFETYEQDGKLYSTDVVNFSAVCRRFAEALATTNPRFNPDQFISACNGGGTVAMTPSMIRAYRFFFEHAGYIVGQRAQCALGLARAENYARDNDWEAEWVADDCPDLSWMSDEERRQPHDVLGCVLRDANGNVLASLWGITDPTVGYMRVVAAELSSEAMHNEQQLPQDVGTHATLVATIVFAGSEDDRAAS